ncbi:MAG: transposase [Proteobacteria bacterium]|nr:transposase [Pseudomonadota bacterium]
MQIYLNSPWENDYNESFNGTVRRETLKAEWFATTRQVQTVINQWLRQYNHVLPRHALVMQLPIPKMILVKSQITGTEQGDSTAVPYHPPRNGSQRAPACCVGAALHWGC